MTTRLYLLDEGDMFIGTIAQFKDCFFSNATESLIADFAAENEYELRIVDVENVAEWVSAHCDAHITIGHHSPPAMLM